MYPQKIETDPDRIWYGEDYFESEKYIHSYLHKNYRTKMHSHQFYEINIVINGEGRHYISDSSIPAMVGDVFVIPPSISHGYFTENSLDIYHILLKTDFFNRYREELVQLPGFDLLFDFEPSIRRFSGTNFNLNIDSSHFSSIEKDLKNIKEAEDEGLYMYQNILVLSLISRLGKMFNKRINKASSQENLEIITIMEYIKNNLGNKIVLSDIAKFCSMSTSTLNRRFKEFLGVSPMQYVINCRVSIAKELLQENRLSKTEIAQVCGFYDLVHMNKCLAKSESNI